jgi:hypothetical protein
MALAGELKADQQKEARAIQRRKREKLLKKIWQRSVAAGDTRAAATCIQLGADVSWPVLHGNDSMPALQFAAQLDDWAMVYLLLLSGAERRSPVNALLQNWYSGLLYHKDYDVDVQGSGMVEVLTVAASASKQKLRAHPPQLLLTMGGVLCSLCCDGGQGGAQCKHKLRAHIRCAKQRLCCVYSFCMACCSYSYQQPRAPRHSSSSGRASCDCSSKRHSSGAALTCERAADA